MKSLFSTVYLTIVILTKVILHACDLATRVLADNT